jgi:hypothetical protein
MPNCFVIQPFDGGPFDKRYEDVIAPAICTAGYEPYRVDRDPSVSIPIEDIEIGIRSADVCLAEITTDNPNVWYELGFAIASQKEIVLLCAADRRSKFPFDVQHRRIITYSTDSTSDFETLKNKITERMRAIQQKEKQLATLASKPIADIQGLAAHELFALVSIGQNADSPFDSVSTYIIRQDMERGGFTRIATTLALSGLLTHHLITQTESSDYDGNTYIAFVLTQDGLDWLVQNQNLLNLNSQSKTKTASIPFDSDEF